MLPFHITERVCSFFKGHNMQKKQKVERDQATRAIKLFAKLLFTGRFHSLAELAKTLDCSKQTVLRIVDIIESSYSVKVELSKRGKQNYYQIKKNQRLPTLNLTESELRTLFMCAAFSRHLLGDDFFEEAARALDKSIAQLPRQKEFSPELYGVFASGSIDYTPHQKTMRLLTTAMENKKVCKLTYKNLMAADSKTFYIKPLKIFSSKNTVYLHAQMAKSPGKKYMEPDFDPLLAIHRIKKIEVTDRVFEFPENYDFEKVFNRNFGIIKEESFKVTVEFSGSAGVYVSERIWSPEQKIVRKRNGNLQLTFSASSEPETIAWILSFGKSAELIKPDSLVEKIKIEINRMADLYFKNK